MTNRRLRPSIQHLLVSLTIAVLAALSAYACGGGGSPTSPSGSGGTSGGTTGGGTTGGGSSGAASCRTAAATSTSVQTFVDGTVTSSNTSCSHNTTTNDIVCNSSFTDTRGGTGTVTQTSRFSSRNDIVDEVAVIPTVSRGLGTTTVTTSGGTSLTTTSTNTYDGQRRLMTLSTVTGTPLGPITTTTNYTAWDSSGRPTTGNTTLTSVGVTQSFPETDTYDNGARTVTRVAGPNTCTQTYDANGNITKEVCTGTTASTTNVTVLTTAQICK